MSTDEFKKKYQINPVLFNERYQAQRKYVGNDLLHSETVPKGTLLSALEIEGAIYYIKADDLLAYQIGINAPDMGSSCMVLPWLKNNYQDTASYRYNIRVYELREDMVLAVGSITENPQFGSGEDGKLNQYVIPYGNDISKKGIEQAVDGKDDAELLPVCLAEPERYTGHKNYQVIKALEEAYGNRVDRNELVNGEKNKNYGCIQAEKGCLVRRKLYGSFCGRYHFL